MKDNCATAKHLREERRDDHHQRHDPDAAQPQVYRGIQFPCVTVPDGIPAIIPKDLFDRVQARMERTKKAPAQHKAEDDYILTTKLRCGKCKCFMAGESGTSHVEKEVCSKPQRKEGAKKIKKVRV